MKPLLSLLRAAALASGVAATTPAAAQPAPVTALPVLDIPAYMGTWYQVAWFPNRFQKQCVSDTAATYRWLPSGEVEVVNRCRLAEGSIDSVTGVARPDGSKVQGDTLSPAQLRVSFLPAWLRWLPAWGRYWVLDLAEDGRYAVVSEPTREYLWVLARAPQLSDSDRTAIRSTLQRQGFDLTRWQDHLHKNPAAPAP